MDGSLAQNCKVPRVDLIIAPNGLDKGSAARLVLHILQRYGVAPLQLIKSAVQQLVVWLFSQPCLAYCDAPL